jgi:hypothetical protein
LIAENCKLAVEPLNASQFELSPYRPTPTIVEAARALYAGHQIADIGRGDAADAELQAAANALLNIVLRSQQKTERIVCFVTGAPGAGKTLLGLDLALKKREGHRLAGTPMKIEQRIGRVDRIGQKHIVRAMNFALEGTIEQEKLARILEEFGVDKLADVLDSEEGSVRFEELFAQAIFAPEEAERRASALADEIRRRAEEARASSRLLSAMERLDPSAAQKIASHQMPYWTERMTLANLRSQETAGASAKPAGPRSSLAQWRYLPCRRIQP